MLVIDDDDDTRAPLRLLFEDEGYTVIESADGDDALTTLHTSPRGLVVVFDYRMPRMDGEALLALAERERWLADHHAFICVTASSNLLPPTVSDLLARYRVPLVGKPFELDGFLAVITQAAQRLARLPALALARPRDEPPESGQ